MYLKPTIQEDIPLIERWLKADPRHSTDPRNSAEGLLTGKGLFSFCLADDKGPLCFVRLDAEGDMARVAIQFGPENEVSKRRLIVGLMTTGFPAMTLFLKKNNFKGAVFESVNQPLIDFLEKYQHFRKAAKENDYTLIFGEENDV